VTRAQWPKRPDGPSRSARGHRVQDRCGGTIADAGNGDQVGRSDGGEHQQDRASPLGKVAGGGTLRGDAAAWRRRSSFGPAVFVGDERRTTVGGGLRVS
jgi:hypothetical protein